MPATETLHKTWNIGGKQASFYTDMQDVGGLQAALDSLSAGVEAGILRLIASDAQNHNFASPEALNGATTFFAGGEQVTPKVNDCAIVVKDNATYLYKCTNATGPVWQEYHKLLSTVLTTAQWDVLNGGGSATKLAEMVSATTAAQAQADKAVADAATAQAVADRAEEATVTNAAAITALQGRVEVRMYATEGDIPAEVAANDNILCIVDRAANAGA